MNDQVYDIHLDIELPLPETPLPGSDPEPWGETQVVGKALPRVDGYHRVSGTAVYPSDIVLPRMLHGAILRCPHPHARVRSIDTREAEKMPGVHAVIDSRTPEADIVWPARGGEPTRLFDTICRFEGEAVAAVAAETPYQARDALAAIRVDYEVLPAVSDERDALAEDAPQVFPSGNLVREPQVYERGDVAAGFAAADVVLERDYRVEAELHVPLERHGCVASWDGQMLNIWESTQGVFSVQAVVARVLDLPISQVRVIGHYMGGGFGSKLAPGKYTIIATLLAAKTARPVKIFVTREETMLSCGNRPPAQMTLKAGVMRDGTLTALQMSGLGTGGAYGQGGVSLLDWLTKDLYSCPNVRTELTEVYTNAGPARPMRGPGHPQNAWALEQLMDELAEAIEMDPVSLRVQNVPLVSQGRGGTPYSVTGLKECLEEGAKAFDLAGAREHTASMNQDYEANGRPWRIGVGMAACTWIAGAGGPPSTVTVKLFRDGSVSLNMGAADLGTGTKTVMAMVVAEELGVNPQLILIENADTATTAYTGPSGGSKTVPSDAPAVRDAAIQVKRQLLEMAAEQLEIDVEDLLYRGTEIVSRSDAQIKLALGELNRLRRFNVVVGTGYRGPNPEGKAICPFAAQFCEVAVNMDTGEVQVVRFLGAHDSGRVLNRKTYDSQVYGGITMGIGLGMTEARVLDRGQTGKLCNKNWHDYKLPTAKDVPVNMTSLPLEIPDLICNTTGAKGLGEPVTIPTAAAIANAVYAATGMRTYDTPITPLRICELLAARKEAQR